MDFGDNANVYNVFTSYNLARSKAIKRERKKERERWAHTEEHRLSIGNSFVFMS